MGLCSSSLDESNRRQAKVFRTTQNLRTKYKNELYDDYGRFITRRQHKRLVRAKMTNGTTKGCLKANSKAARRINKMNFRN